MYGFFTYYASNLMKMILKCEYLWHSRGIIFTYWICTYQHSLFTAGTEFTKWAHLGVQTDQFKN